MHRILVLAAGSEGPTASLCSRVDVPDSGRPRFVMPWTNHQLIALNGIRTVSTDRLYRLALDPSLLSVITAHDAEEGADIDSALEKSGETAVRETEGAERSGAVIVTWNDPLYPRALRELELPPPVLYVRGALAVDADANASLQSRPAVAIVGSRKTDAYGREAGRMFGRDIAAAGVTVVSGLAAGVDGAAHRGALEAHGATIGVLGCGIDSVYPRQHKSLAEEMTVTGAVISQFAIGTPPRARNFPVRNHLIAALSQMTLVVRATLRSGSLITARLALDLGREVFAMPGSIFDPRSQGCHALLADGAGLAQHPRDLLELFPGLRPSREDPGEAPADVDAEVWSALPPLGESVGVDKLAECLSMPPDELLAELTKMEIAGHVGREPGDRFGRRRR